MDYTKLTIQDKKDLIDKYNDTKDPKILEQLVEIYSRYLKYIVGQLRRVNTLLAIEDFEDLYQDAVVGLLRAVRKIPTEEDPIKVPAWIKAYVKAEIRRVYRFKEREFSGQKDYVFDACRAANTLLQGCSGEDLKYIFKASVAWRWDLDVLVKVYIEGLTVRQVAKLKFCKVGKVKKALKRCLGILKHVEF